MKEASKGGRRGRKEGGKEGRKKASKQGRKERRKEGRKERMSRKERKQGRKMLGKLLGLPFFYTPIPLFLTYPFF